MPRIHLKTTKRFVRNLALMLLFTSVLAITIATVINRANAYAYFIPTYFTVFAINAYINKLIGIHNEMAERKLEAFFQRLDSSEKKSNRFQFGDKTYLDFLFQPNQSWAITSVFLAIYLNLVLVPMNMVNNVEALIYYSVTYLGIVVWSFGQNSKLKILVACILFIIGVQISLDILKVDLIKFLIKQFLA